MAAMDISGIWNFLRHAGGGGVAWPKHTSKLADKIAYLNVDNYFLKSAEVSVPHDGFFTPKLN